LRCRRLRRHRHTTSRGHSKEVVKMVMSDKDKATMELMRAMLRPLLIIGMGIGTFLLIINDVDTEFAQWWMRIFYGGAAEWILERPAIKALKGVKGGSH